MITLASILILCIPVNAQATTDFYQLSDEAFALGLIIDAYQTTPDGSNQYAVASRTQGRNIYILDGDFEQIAYLTPAQNATIAAEDAYGVVDIAWSPDGNWLMVTIDVVMGSYVQLWDMNTYTPIITVEGIFSGVTAWSPDSTNVAISEDSRVLVIEGATGYVAHEFFMSGSPDAFALAWDSESERLAALNIQGVVDIWFIDTETMLFEINGANAELTGSEVAQQNLSYYELVAWAPNELNQIALYDSSSLNIDIWDISQQQIISSLPTNIENLRQLYWTPSGIVLYDTFPRDELDSIQIWDPSDGSVLYEKILQQSEYVIKFPNLDDEFEIVVGTAPLTQDLAESLTVETIPIPPLADAGIDQTVTDEDNSGSASATMDGSGSSDSDGTIVSYSWSENDVEIATGAQPEVELAVGSHAITLTVTDDDGATDSDEVVIVVNAPPTANAGSD